MLKIKDIALRFGVTEHTVLSWVHNGELAAVDVSRSRGGRPIWRIDPEALEAFQAARMPVPPPPKPVRRHRKDDADTIDFY